MCNSLSARSDYNRRASRREANVTLNVVGDNCSAHVACSYVVCRVGLPMRATQSEYTPRSESYVAQRISCADTDEFGLGAQANDNL